MVLCVVWEMKSFPMHTVLECLTMLETELPCQLSQHLMPLKMTGRSSSEAATNNTSHFQDSQFSVAYLHCKNIGGFRGKNLPGHEWSLPKAMQRGV